jgi:predicted Zn-dependent protease
MISTRRRVEYASGYLELGLTAAAAAELAAIAREDEDQPEVLRVRTEYLMQAREWGRLVEVAADMASRLPDEEAGWISWAYALRELNRVEEARTVLINAEFRHGKTCGVLHYNLACYACLLGERTEAMQRLRRALRLSAEWREAAMDDTDLQPLWQEISRMK